jgi:hypothetical protein
MDYNIVVIPGHSERGLSFEIKVFLPPKVDLTLQPMDRILHSAGGIAFCIDPRAILKAAFGVQGLLDRQYGRFGCDLNYGQSSGAAGQMVALGDHQENGLSGIMHPAISEERLVMGGGGDVIGMGEIFGLQHQMHPGAGAHGIEIHRLYLPRCAGRQAKGQV